MPLDAPITAAAAAETGTSATKPKVLFVSPVPDFKGGAEVVLRTMLANPHVAAVLATPSPGPLSEAAEAMGIPVCHYHPGAMLLVRRPPRPRAILAAAADAVRCAARLRRLALQHGCDLIHSNGLKTHLLCVLMAGMTRVPTLVHLHDIPYQRAERMIWRLIARSVTRVILVSRPCYPDARLPRNVEVVRNGIAMVPTTLQAPRPAGTLRLAFIGRFHPAKGLDRLVDWFGAVRAAGLDATLTIRGRPDADNVGYWERIKERIGAEGLAPFVLQEGWVTGPATYANIDVLLLPSQLPDPAPLVIPEAMSADVVVAAYPTGGIPDMIDDGRTGLLVAEAPALVARLMSFQSDPAALERIRTEAKREVLEEGSLDAFHARLDRVYQAMLGRPAQA